jgi:hypothetical protein
MVLRPAIPSEAVDDGGLGRGVGFIGIISSGDAVIANFIRKLCCEVLVHLQRTGGNSVELYSFVAPGDPEVIGNF